MNFKLKYLLLVFISSISIAQNLKVDYQVTLESFDRDSTIEISQQQEVMLKRIEERMKNSAEKQIVTLYTKPDNQFLLEVKKEMGIDGQYVSSLGVSLLKIHTYVYGRDDNSNLGYDDGQDFIVKYENRMVEWNITSEYKDILGFKCYKATPKYFQKYDTKELNSYPTEVWFAPSINKRGGPIVHSNLPGLILEVKSKQFLISASSIEEIQEDKKVPQIDKEIITEFQAYKRTKATAEAMESRMRN